MLRVGLTGGIGSGKSTVCNYFRKVGAAIVDTDILAREVVEPGSSGLELIVKHFSQAILLEDGSLNRDTLRKIAFNDPNKRQLLESILHPLIRQRLKNILVTIKADYVIIAIPLLLEKGWQAEVDRILVVDCTEEQQVERIIQRDGNDRSLIMKIIQSQVSRHQRLAAADDIIHNNNDMVAIREQVEKLHKQYLQLAAGQS